MMNDTNTTTNTSREVITFIRPRTGKTYERVNGIWHLNGKPIPESGRGNRAVQWQIESEYQSCRKMTAREAYESDLGRVDQDISLELEQIFQDDENNR